MKKVFIFIVVLLSACSQLSSEEQLFVGKWSWNYEQEGFGESGFLKLTKDGKYSYLIESWNPTEKLSESFSDEVYDWSLKDGSLCLSRGSNEPDICKWTFSVDPSREPTLEFKGVFVKANIKATNNSQ